MDVNEQGSNGIHSADPSDEDSPSSYLPEISDICEESVLLPRVGEQYQVEISPVVTKSEDAKISANDIFGIGLAIPVKWIQYAVDNINIKCQKEELSNVDNFLGMEAHLHNKSTQVDYKLNTRVETPENPNISGKHLQRSECKIELFDSSGQVDHVPCLAKLEIQDNDEKDYCSFFPSKKKAGGYIPLPGSPTLSLSDLEEQSFLVGLYIFGKNLVQVKKFMETNRIGDVLSFYYGKFYRSDAYRKWSECRKVRSRRSIHGQRIFTGWRQQELLSRLLNTTSKELQDTLLEAAKAFNEGRSTLEEFVFRLKAAAGLQILVEAIGIGNGTHDLTVMALDHPRTNQPVPLNPEIPVGRACSSLTSADIIKFLTGDFRLSKARSNDLFWEAVWPRLLARGWRSEQPKDHGSLTFKNALVFLVPGVKKFSKKKLVKGTHFFDSLTDVLSKVASDPTLLEFDVEGEKDCRSAKEENGCGVDSRVYRNDSFNLRRHCYMHPSIPSSNLECMKFTVVDTSLVQREGSFKVMELRCLPLDSPLSCVPFADSEESGDENLSAHQGSTSSSAEEGCDSNLISFGEKKPEVSRSTHSELSKTSKPLFTMTNGHAPGSKGLVKPKYDKTVERKNQNNRRVKSSQTNCSAPTLKRRKLATCSRGCDPLASGKSVQQDKKQTHLKPVRLRAADSLNPNSDSFQENNIVRCENLRQHKLESQTLIDLNNLPPDTDFTESTSNEFKPEDILLSSLGKQRSCDQVSRKYYGDIPSDDQPLTGLRRQSTRNRPPTAKALEALASGLLGTKRSWRSSSTSSSRPSQKARKAHEETASTTAPNPANVASSALSMSVEEPVSEDYEKCARKATHELLGVP